MPDDVNAGGNGNPPDGDSNAKFEDQVELILSAFGSEVEIDPPDWRTAGVNSIYRTNSVLVRDQDASEAARLLGGDIAGRGRLGIGVSRLDLPRDVPAG
jgi:hypothetical protein